MKKGNIKKCYLCGSKNFERVEGKVRDLPEMPVLRCIKCGLVFLANFDHIDDKFYEESKMRDNEPLRSWRGYLKESSPDDSRRAAWVKSRFSAKSLLDFGCGAGGFLMKAKRFIKNCSGVEQDSNWRKTVEKCLKIRVYSDIDEVNGRFDLISLFHVLEHFKEPKDVLIKLSGRLNKGGKIIIEVPNSNDALLSLYENKAFSEFTYWRCHLYLFNVSNLKRLIKSTGLRVDFIAQVQRYPLSNHLYWLSKGRPGGHKCWSFIDTEELNNTYAAQLARLDACDTLLALATKAHG